MSAHNPVVGEILSTDEMHLFPAGVLFERNPNGGRQSIRITFVPEVVDPTESLAVELFGIRYPGDVSFTDSLRGITKVRWEEVAAWVLENFERNGATSTPDLSELVDRDGDTWYRVANGRYSLTRFSDGGDLDSRTLEDIQSRWGAAPRSLPTNEPLSFKDRSGDRWERQPDGTYSIRWNSGDLEMSRASGLAKQTLEEARSEWGPLTDEVAA